MKFRHCFTLTCLIFVTLAFEANTFAVDRGYCRVGMELGPGDSCTYYSTDDKFTVSADGIASFMGTSAERADIAHTHDPGTHHGYMSHGVAGTRHTHGADVIRAHSHTRMAHDDLNEHGGQYAQSHTHGFKTVYKYLTVDGKVTARSREDGSGKYRITFLGATAPNTASGITRTGNTGTGNTGTETATTLEAVSGSGQSAQISTAVANPFVVRVLDQNGDAMAGVTVSFTVTPGGILNPTSATTGANGQAETRLTLGSATGTYTITASTAGVTLAATFTATATAQPVTLTATTIEAVSGSGQSAKISSAVTNPFVVRVLDQNGAAMSGVSVSFSVTPDGTLNPTSTTTGTNGEAQTHLTLGSTAGTYTITASAAGITDAVTFTATATATPITIIATTLVAVSGSGQNAQTSSAIANPFVVCVLDQNGAAMSGVSVSFSVTPDGTLNPTSTTTGTNGEAQTYLTLGSTAGTYTITASAAGITDTVTFTATATATPVTLTATTLESVSGSGQSAQTSTAIANPFVVRVLDQNGAAMSGVSVSFFVTPGGTLNPTSTTTGANGEAQTYLTLGSTAGTYTITASAAGITDTVTFTATATATPITLTATTIEAVSGSGQSAQTSTAVTNPFVVSVLDQNGAAMPGVSVSFSVTPGGTLNPTSTTTGTNGEAQTHLTLGSSSGTYTITASVAGITQTVSFTATAITAEQQGTSDTVPEPTIPLSKLAATGQISFSELMLASRGGLHSLPQWIELYNNSDTETVNLRNWQLMIEARDTNGTHRNAIIPLEEFTIAPNQTALIVTFGGRYSAQIPDNRIYNFFNHHADEFEQNTHRNMVLGQSGFFLSIADPYGAVSDTAGNIDGNRMTEDAPSWEIPKGTTQDGQRTSLLRRYAHNTENPLDGTDQENWRRAANFGRVGMLPELAVSMYWGRKTDIGNPGYKGSGALPVTLSKFRAEYTKAGVVLKWTTESELDNAGFYIYRSDKKDGQFKVVNPTMIQGAGTTAKRQNYTWTDTTAKPNTVYYYQIEDVSHTGEHKRLATVRMQGFVSAQGKMPTSWANVKNSRADY